MIAATTITATETTRSARASSIVGTLSTMPRRLTSVERVDDDHEQPEADRDPDWQRPIDKFKRSSVGSVVAAGLLGVRDALEGRPEREEITVVAEAPAQPVRGNIEIVLDPDHPERSIAVVRRPAPDRDLPGGGLQEERGDQPV
jgi:hypothetical protein